MPMNKIPRLREPRGPVVQQVRDLFLETEYKQAPDEFHPQDMELVKKMDFLLQRCVIMQRKNVQASVNMLSQVLKWRKQRALHDLRELHFPQELTMAGAGFIYEADKFGNRTMYLRAGMCKNCGELKPAMKDFLTYLVFNLDDPSQGTTYAIIMDLTGATLSNYDIDLMMYVVTLLRDYFPVNLDYFLCVNFPWILSAAWSLIKRLIPSESRNTVQFISSDKIFDFVDRESCPDFLGGSCARPYSWCNPQAPTIYEYLTVGKSITKRRLGDILNLYSDALPDSHIAKLHVLVENFNEEYNNSLSSSSNNNNNNSEEDLKAAKVEQGKKAGKAKKRALK